tara:strand:+ start:63 stop:278 length:216 start_codon:yes stop_codon:yes gene_type:complete
MTDDRSEDASYENERSTPVGPMVHISLTEYEELKKQSKMITDPDLISVIDKLDELLRVLRRRINRTDIFQR